MEYVFEALQSSCRETSIIRAVCDGFCFLCFTSQSGINYHNPSGEPERVLTNVKDGGVRCIVLRRRRQVREREVEIEVLILLRLTHIASEPT